MVVVVVQARKFRIAGQGPHAVDAPQEEVGLMGFLWCSHGLVRSWDHGEPVFVELSESMFFDLFRLFCTDYAERLGDSAKDHPTRSP